MEVVLTILIKEGPLGVHFLRFRRDNQKENLPYGNFGDRSFALVPNKLQGLGFRAGVGL